MPPRRIALTIATTLLVALAGCTSKQPQRAAELPAGDGLLRGAATEMKQVKTARFVIDSDGGLSIVPVRHADGRLNRDGNAKGTVQLDQGGTTVDFEFVIVGSTAYVKGLTGGWQSLPLAFASNVYDPSAILDPDRGVAKVIETATEPRTEAREKVDGTDAYRIAAKFDKEAIGRLVPGAGDGVTGQFWIGVDRKLPVRAKFTVPSQSNGRSASVTVKFSEYDQPVTISAPK